MKTLVVQKDPAVREAVAAALGRAGHELSFAGSVREAEQALSGTRCEALVIDLALPGESAVSLVRRLRSAAETRAMAILVVSERSTEDARLLGFEAGVDDYVGVPFSGRELAARMDAIFRRHGEAAPGQALEVRGLRIDPISFSASAGGRTLPLTRSEFRLLHFMMARAGRTLSRAQLLEHLRTNEALVEERSVDAHINRLRRALSASGHEALIQTVTGEGYRFSS
ncbi:MAG TPA: winged helix-turn-helix domain-containing protein [Burkholderiales bacterium]|nr:winged helix-turn-helix domain-containing protein [Burkholderiales bacterium]